MTSFATDPSDAIPLHVIGPETAETQLAELGESTAAWAAANGFSGGQGAMLCVPAANGGIASVLVGRGKDAARARSRFLTAAATTKLPAGTYALSSGLDDVQDRTEFALGWLLSGYRFDRYHSKPAAKAHLVAPEGLDADCIECMAASEALIRDLINTPASDMGPSALEAEARALAKTHGAEIKVVVAEDLLAHNLPLIHTVGRAAADAPRLIDMAWGDTGPSLVLVGKGVCFDTGGLNLKPGGSMGLMKKDMGGAANVLGLAHMIMALNWQVRLRVLIPAVENAVSGNAFRPQDILTSRKGLTVEINNTDAEGRLVLADALALADEADPDLIISMATLTGAARVAVGPDLAPFFTTDETLAAALPKGAQRGFDPVWRLPFYEGYEPMIEPGIADLDNAPKGGFGGAITAALFLRRFVSTCHSYTHFDIYGWNPSSAPARPKGGAGQGPRALLETLPEVLGL